MRVAARADGDHPPKPVPPPPLWMHGPQLHSAQTRQTRQ